MREVKELIRTRTNWNEETVRKVQEGYIKITKMVPGDIFEFSDEDWDFIKARGINLIVPMDDERKKLYRIWQQKLIYSTNQVVRLADRIVGGVHPDSAMSSSGSTMLDEKTLNSIVGVAGDVLRNFMSDLVTYVEDPKNSPFNDLTQFDNLWMEVRRFRDAPEEFTDEKLLNRRDGIPRIEVRGKEEGSTLASQVVVVGIPGKYRRKAMQLLDAVESDEGLVIESGGTMAIEVKKSGVNKALPMGYVGRHFDEILDRIGYTPGEYIDARKTRSIIFSDGDGTLYRKPGKDGNPTLSESPAAEELVEYLRAGGIYMINTGNDLRLTVDRLLANNAIPSDLRHRLLICGNGGSDIVGVDEKGGLIRFPEYKENALREFWGASNLDDTKGMDFIYIGDDADEQGSDFIAFKKAGMGRSITVAKEEIGDIPASLRENYIGGLEFGTKTFLKNVIRQAKMNPHQRLFSKQTIKDIVRHSRNDSTALDQNQLNDIVNEFISQVNECRSGGTKTSLAVEPSYFKSSSGNERGDYIAVDWGGSNLRVMLVRLRPG
ncbi:MAG: hypothetical protein WCI27_07695, partial [Candidatus Omnitrophota bacterium]